jgi:hypothetical protein
MFLIFIVVPKNTKDRNESNYGQISNLQLLYNVANLLKDKAVSDRQGVWQDVRDT